MSVVVKYLPPYFMLLNGQNDYQIPLEYPIHKRCCLGINQYLPPVFSSIIIPYLHLALPYPPARKIPPPVNSDLNSNKNFPLIFCLRNLFLDTYYSAWGHILKPKWKILHH